MPRRELSPQERERRFRWNFATIVITLCALIVLFTIAYVGDALLEEGYLR